jgi:hypothetical protein
VTHSHHFRADIVNGRYCLQDTAVDNIEICIKRVAWSSVVCIQVNSRKLINIYIYIYIYKMAVRTKHVADNLNKIVNNY